jgi:hypothetical protein
VENCREGMDILIICFRFCEDFPEHPGGTGG